MVFLDELGQCSEAFLPFSPADPFSFFVFPFFPLLLSCRVSLLSRFDDVGSASVEDVETSSAIGQICPSCRIGSNIRFHPPGWNELRPFSVLWCFYLIFPPLMMHGLVRVRISS